MLDFDLEKQQLIDFPSIKFLSVSKASQNVYLCSHLLTRSHIVCSE